MDKIELFRLYADPAYFWSAWTKPVLFASLNAEDFVNADPLPTPGWLPSIEADGTALIVDLGGVASVVLGVALIDSGFCPVPLFNGCRARHHHHAVEVDGILGALIAGGGILKTKTFDRAAASPAFLLDAHRLSGAGSYLPGMYDNRWTVTPQDLPSGKTLKDRGIRRIVVVADSIMQDLNQSLFRFQEAGLELLHHKPPLNDAQGLRVSKPSNFKSLRYRAQVWLGLRRNSTGGFGGIVPDPSASGYSGG